MVLIKKCQHVWRGQSERGTRDGEVEKKSLKRLVLRGTVWKLWIPFILDMWSSLLTDAVFNLKWTMDKQKNVLRMQFFFPFFFCVWRGEMLFVIYLKIEQAHSGFHKGDEANGFCQCPSFQVVLKPVNKLSTRGPFHARGLINKTHCFCEANAINSFALATLYKIIHRIFVLIWSIRYMS